MSTDIEQRLRDAHPESVQYASGSTILLDAAEEIARLRDALDDIACMQAERDEWDAVEKYAEAQRRARQALRRPDNQSEGQS